MSNQIWLHGWLVFRCVEGEERILSAKKERSFIKSSQRKCRAKQIAAETAILFIRDRQNLDVTVEYW